MIIKLAWQQLFAQYKSGDLRVLVFALVLAVTSITAVNFFTNRIASHLNAQGGLLLGGDIVVIADHPIAADFIESAKQYGLQSASTLEFASMAIVNNKNQLAEVKALGDGFPLRGDFNVQFAQNKLPVNVKAVPKQGEVWVEPRLANALGIKLGDELELGASQFKVAGILMREPSRGGDMFSFAPRLMMNSQDVAATALIQFGSRVKYQLLAAGKASQVQQFSAALSPTLQRGERIEDVKTARPEIRSTLDKAETFLGLSAMVSVVLSVVAMLLASGPFVARSQESAALLRTFGANKNTIMQISLLQTAVLALIGAVLGSLLGFFLQHVLAYFAGKLFLEALPAPSYTPIAVGFALSFALLFAIMWPHIQALKNIPAIRILRNNYAPKTTAAWQLYWPVILVIIVLILWVAKTIQLALAFIIGITALCLVTGVLAYALAQLLYGLAQRSAFQNTLGFGLANLKRRLGLSIAQMIGFSLGAMVLMLLMMIKTDLMQSWRASLPIDAPNRFIINIQPNQVAPVQAFIKKIGLSQPQVFPMIRGRLVAKNNQLISADLFDNERAKRLVSREFNLSTAATMQADNKLLQGRWWRAGEESAPLLSLEDDIAKVLNVKLGDTLTYDIAGSKVTLTVTSIRKVEWDSMRANFFAVTPPNALNQFSASYMTAFYLAKNQDNALNNLLQQFTNFTVIDVASLMNQVRDIMQKLATAIGFVFTFCIVAGLVVLYAALVATREARIRESALLRVLGASRAQTAQAMLIEFACIGTVSATVAVLVASALSFYLSRFILDIPYQFNGPLALSVFVAAFIFIPLAAWLVIKSYLNVPPKQLLNSI